jgi:hypothetical protein
MVRFSGELDQGAPPKGKHVSEVAFEELKDLFRDNLASIFCHEN